MTTIRNSHTHPLRIDTITLPNGARIGMTFCPGKKQSSGMTGAWDRNLDTDLAAIKSWNPTTMIMCPEPHEYNMLQVAHIHDACAAHHISTIPFPFADDTIPTPEQQTTWDQDIEPYILDILQSGGSVIIFCKGGLGRTGLLASFLLTAMGQSGPDSVRDVRAIRTGTIYTAEQERAAMERISPNTPYPRAIVTVDIALYALGANGTIHIGLTQRTQRPYIETYTLLGGMIHVQQDRDTYNAAQRVLAHYNITAQHIEQVRTYADNHRDPRGWSISTLYMAIINHMVLHPDITWYKLSDLPTLPLGFDHRTLIEDATNRLQNKSSYSTLPLYMITAPFTMSQAMHAYRACIPADHALDPANFRRKILHTQSIEPHGQLSNTRGAPSTLYHPNQTDIIIFPKPITQPNS